MIEVTGLNVGYFGRKVLFDISLIIPRGKITVIVGPNGCGKSTLLKALCGILPAESGSITIDQKKIEEYRRTMLARQIAYLAQSRNVPDITAGQLVLHGRFPYLSYPRRYSKNDLQIAHDAMERLGITELADTSLKTLSGGMRQKVYIAMALAQNTQTVLLDEPTTFLDVSHQLQLLDNVRFLCQEGKTVVMVLHDLPMALKTADQLIVMKDGKVYAQGNPETIYNTHCLEDVFDVGIGKTKCGSENHYYIERRGIR